MPIPENVARIHLNWALGADEIAVSTFHMQLQHGAGNTLDWPTAVNTLAEKTAKKWNQRVGPAADQFAAAVSLRDVAVYHLGASDGKTLDKGQYVPTGSDQFKGSAIAALPSEVALAVSLYAYAPGTFVPNRASLRGRFYLPPLGTNVMGVDDHAFRIGVAPQNALKNALSDFLNDMHHTSADASENPFGGQDWWSLGVLSRKLGQFHHVTTMRLGNVPDVQRRRREALREVYIDAVVSDG